MCCYKLSYWDETFRLSWQECSCFLSAMIINSLAPGRLQFNFRWAIFMLTLVNRGWGISHEIALGWIPLDLIDDKPSLVQVMAWCRQAASHYLSQCLPRPMSPYGVSRPWWVDICKWNKFWVCEWYWAYPLSYPFNNTRGCVFSVHHFPRDDPDYIYIYCLIIIAKTEVWTIIHCLGLGHETMVCIVCLLVFFWRRLAFCVD